jgi:hypothetical protein
MRRRIGAPTSLRALRSPADTRNDVGALASRLALSEDGAVADLDELDVA